MSQFKYEEKSLLGGWRIEVKKGPLHIGNIFKDSNGDGFRYFSGRDNQLTPSLHDSDLVGLKSKIEQL